MCGLEEEHKAGPHQQLLVQFHFPSSSTATFTPKAAFFFIFDSRGAVVILHKHCP